MGKYSHDELEQAFRTYWRTRVVGEDWDAWVDLFTADCTYTEHWYGSLTGREAVRSWIKPVMAKFPETYTAHDWHVVDPERGRVVVYMQNRRDHPSGSGTVDFAGITVLEYAGNGLWQGEEDYWTVRGRELAMKEYEGALARHHPQCARRATRLNWGGGPEWTRGAPSYAERRPLR